MRATVMHSAGDVRIENVADSRIVEPTDALVVVSRACICGSDLWPYRGLEDIPETGRRMGHEAIGVVEAVGADVRTMKAGDVVEFDGSCVLREMAKEYALKFAAETEALRSQNTFFGKKSFDEATT